ncbi:MAG: hypothetical protein HY671_12035 [Chloroflexi bacterium]|nr:hypothetical protein [Chloroflexota bacterium]
MSLQKVGEWAFIAGVIIAVLGGAFIPGVGAMALALVVLGIIVGIINITEKETVPYLVAAIALIAAGTANFGAVDVLTGQVIKLGARFEGILDYVSNFVAPGAVIVALKTVWSLSKTK